ncbi:DNA glycosylase [Wallemia mellicola]|uniref:DNA glycosylase n=1 Tax=Wallemia mellicola TaxID=1708541 RepID=A0A4T0TEH2_9BASI|nr:DNA glycosylase [Wallemia mellicola]
MSSSPSPPPSKTPRLRYKPSRTDTRLTMVEIDDKDTKRAPLKRSVSSFTKQKRIQRELDVPHEAPENWETVYDLIKEMRSTQLAPVDTLGCERAPTENLDARTKRYQILVSLMLSSQTKEGLDAVTSDAVNNLREQLEGGLTLESVLAATDKQIRKILAFYNHI